MALDVALARTAGETPTLRFYAWEPYCLSLGYAQKPEEFDRRTCLDEGIDMVRRPTGGRAILHAEELTYSVTISNRHALFRLSILEFYRYFSAGLARGFSNLGLPVTIERTGIKRDHEGLSPAPLCFSSVGRNDLKVRGRKVVGSAQRRFPESLLQHGSILLGDYHLRQEELLAEALRPKRQVLAGYTTDVRSEIGKDVSYAEAVAAFKGGVEQALDLRLVPRELTEEETGMAREIEKEYSLLDVRGADTVIAEHIRSDDE